MATETLYATSHLAGTVATSANGLGAPNGTYTTDTAATSWTSRYAIGDPVGNLLSTQTITVRVRKDSTNSGTPTATINLYENGTLVSALNTNVNVTSATSQDIVGTFAASAITNRNNIEIEVAVTAAGGGPSVRATVQLDSITLTANTDPSATVTAPRAQGSSLALSPAVSGGGGGGSGVITMQGTPSVYEAPTASTAVVPYPAGIVSGELLTAHITFTGATPPSNTPPAGWTLRQNIDGGGNVQTSTWYRIADGSETGSVTWTSTTAVGRTTGIMIRWSGVDTTTPFDVADVTAVTGAVGTSITAPSQTTVTANAMVVTTVTVHASSTVDIVTAAGWTKSSGSTGTGRRTNVYNRQFASAGATGTTLWDQNPPTATLEMIAISMALRPAPGGGGGGGTVNAVAATATSMMPTPVITNGAGPTPVLNRCVQGIPGTTTHVVKVNTTDAGSVRIKAGTDSGLTTGVVFGAAVTPDAQSNSELTISGLTANTTYFYRIAMTNSVPTESLDTWSTVGKFRTDLNGQLNFTFAFSSCTNATDSAAASAVAVKNPDLVLHLGDEWYADASGTTVANFRTKMGDKKTATNFKEMYRTSGGNWIPSDHDGMNNNSNAGSDATAWTNYNSVYREMNPTTGLPGSGVYRSFKRGRVRFIAIDRRSFATIPSATDNSSKTCLGATQKQWLKDEITNATEPVIIIQNADPWIITTSAGDDGWGGYITERDELATFITASGKNVAMLGGDMHALAAEDGSSSPGGVAMFQAAPWNQAASIKGGPYDVGPYPASGTATVEQYGWMAVTDTGSQIDLVFTGYSADNTQRVTLTKSYSLSSPGSVTAVTALGSSLARVPTVSATAVVVAVAATGSSTAPAPAVTALAAVSAVTALASSLARVPAVSAAASIPAAAAAGSSTAIAPGVTALAAVTAVRAQATSLMLAPSISASAAGAVTAVRAQGSSLAIVPTVVGAQVATVVAVTSTATSLSVPPVVAGLAAVTAVRAQASSIAVAPVVLGAQVANTAAVTATATAAAPAPAVAVSQGVVAVAATATSLARVPAVSAGAATTAVRATGSAAAASPVITGYTSVTVSAPKATATSSAVAPVLALGAVVLGIKAAATAQFTAPFVAGGGAVTISAVRAVATASGASPIISVYGNATAVSATGNSQAIPPSVTGGVTVTGIAASATATAEAPVASVTASISAMALTATAILREPTAMAAAALVAPAALATALMQKPLGGIGSETYLKDGTRVRAFRLIGGILVPVEPIY